MIDSFLCAIELVYQFCRGVSASKSIFYRCLKPVVGNLVCLVLKSFRFKNSDYSFVV